MYSHSDSTCPPDCIFYHSHSACCGKMSALSTSHRAYVLNKWYQIKVRNAFIISHYMMMIYVHPCIDAWYVPQCPYIVPHCTVPHCTMMNMCFTCIILSSINRADQTHWCWLYLQTYKFISIGYHINGLFVDVYDRARLRPLKERWAADCEIDEIKQVTVA